MSTKSFMMTHAGKYILGKNVRFCDAVCFFKVSVEKNSFLVQNLLILQIMLEKNMK